MPEFARQVQPQQGKQTHLLSAKSSAHSGQTHRSGSSVHLQRALGNQAMQRVLRRDILQAKLTVNQPGDVFEQEADRVAASMNFGASCGPAKNTLPMVSIQGGGPGDKSKDAPKGGGTPEQSKAGEQTGNKTPDGVSLGPTDPKKAFCLKPGSYSVKTGHVTEPNFAQGVQIIEFEGSDKGNADGKACSCGCGLYRQWISGTLELITPANLAQANTQLVQDLQKKNIKKAPTPEEVLRYAREKAPKITALGSCNNSIPINVSDFSEEYTNCINKSEKGCKRKFVDQPGPDAKLSDGTYINIQLGFKYEVWDACQGKSVQTQGGKLSIEGSKDPRSVIWPTSKITSSPSQPVQRSATSSNAPGPVPPVVNEALLAPGNLLDPRVRSFFESRFNQDFSHVRVHTDERAAESARAIDAQAYTVGGDVVFAAGRYAPETHSGQKLLAHELAHVVQQGTSTPKLQRWPVRPPTKTESRKTGKTAEIEPKASEPSIQPDCQENPLSMDELIKLTVREKAWGALGLTTGEPPKIPELVLYEDGAFNPRYFVSTPIIKQQVYYLKEGCWPDPEARDIQQGVCAGQRVHKALLSVSQEVANKLKEGELEHCRDRQLAMNLFFGRFAAAAKPLDESETSKLKDLEACLFAATYARDDEHWHDFKMGKPKCIKCDQCTYCPSPERALPGVGKHSSEELMEKAKTKCLQKVGYSPEK